MFYTHTVAVSCHLSAQTLTLPFPSSSPEARLSTCRAGITWHLTGATTIPKYEDVALEMLWSIIYWFLTTA